MRIKHLFAAGMMLAAYATPTRASAQSVLLAFAETYQTAAGTTQVHHGADIALESREVFAPVSGVISFVGRVPAGDGATVLALTIQDAEHLVTLMPLAKTGVAKGESIEAGALVGELAPGGDGSVQQEHLHVGMRKGGVYVDPSALYASSGASEALPDDPVPAGQVAEEPPSAVAIQPPAPCEAVTVSNATLDGGEGDAVTAPGEAAVQPVEEAGAAGVADGAVAAVPDSAVPAAARAVTAAAAISGSSGAVSAPRPGASPAAALAPRIKSAASSVFREPLGLAACAMTVVAVVGLLATRSLTARFQSREPMSDRWLSMLRALRAGDTICGLTSCSGRSAFTDPGPPAQRR